MFRCAGSVAARGPPCGPENLTLKREVSFFLEGFLLFVVPHNRPPFPYGGGGGRLEHVLSVTSVCLKGQTTCVSCTLAAPSIASISPHTSYTFFPLPLSYHNFLITSPFPNVLSSSSLSYTFALTEHTYIVYIQLSPLKAPSRFSNSAIQQQLNKAISLV